MLSTRIKLLQVHFGLWVWGEVPNGPVGAVYSFVDGSHPPAERPEPAHTYVTGLFSCERDYFFCQWLLVDGLEKLERRKMVSSGMY